MARKLTDAQWMARFVDKVGSQRAAAEQLGVSRSLVGRIVKGERSGARYRDAARAGATGRPVTAPAPGPRTPRRVRQPARVPTRDGHERVSVRTPRAIARELERTTSRGHTPTGLVVTVDGAVRKNQYRHKNDHGWSGALELVNVTPEQLARMSSGSAEEILDVLREHYAWLGGAGRVSGLTWED